LTRYHSEFTRSIPASLPAAARPYFENPLLLVQVRPQLERAFAAAPGGRELLQTLLTSVKVSLLHGLQAIFFWSAAIMSASILLHLILKREPLRARMPAATSGATAAASAHLHPAPFPAAASSPSAIDSHADSAGCSSARRRWSA